jgi:glycosyltransferase involved in cell wall biosynthesis
MPVRNGQPWLLAAIESLRSQTVEDIEIVVVDDGSDDDTPSDLQDVSARDDRIVVIRQGRLGLAAALNRGLCEARAEFVARLDADDLAEPDRLRSQFEFLKNHPEVGLLGSWARKIDEAGIPGRLFRPPTTPALIHKVLQRANPMIHSSVMMRLELVKRLGGYRKAFEGAEDYDLWLRISELSQIANIPRPLISYRWHNKSVTSRKAVRQCFSVRLAQSSMALRHAGSFDAADLLIEPPDWNSPAAQSAFYATDAMLYRTLGLAGGDVVLNDSLASADFGTLVHCQPPLSHPERELAVTAFARYLSNPRAPHRAQALGHLVRLSRRRPNLLLRVGRQTLTPLLKMPRSKEESPW